MRGREEGNSTFVRIIVEPVFPVTIFPSGPIRRQSDGFPNAKKQNVFLFV